MKIIFNEIDIKYYKSITSATLVYSKGVWLIKGTNNDAFGSNGAGKSTLLEALQQCLYNRTQNGNTLDTTINRKTGKAYNITVKLSTSSGDFYEINNNRSAMKITIKKFDNGEFVDVGTRSMVAALSYIQNLIGLDFNAFVALTHVTHSTVVNMIDNFTGSNLLKVLLDFGLIQKYEKVLKDELSQSKKTIETFSIREVEINKSLTLINQFKPADCVPLYKSLSELTKEFEKHSFDFSHKMSNIKKREDALTEEHANHYRRLKDVRNILSTKVCSACGTDLSVTKGINQEELEDDIRRLEYLTETISEELFNINKEKSLVLDTLGKDNAEISSRINALRTKIEIQEYNQEMFNKSAESIKELTQELNAIEKQKPLMLKEQDIIISALSAIKQGKLHEEMLNEFCRLNNIYLKELMPYVSIDYLQVSTKHNKNSFNFVLMDSRYNTQIEFTELSGGELTRVRLVVLLAMLKTVQVMTNTSVNILIFDEALDTLDASAADDLANLFRYLSNTESKFISLVSHGQQLNSIEFSGTINVVKTDGSTKVIQEIIGG
jgi:DNA repair exonuclease SbcCD ATPase subunit